MVQACTQIELVEFSRLAYPVCVRWMDTHHDIFRCQPVHGRCRYPDEFIHHYDCRYHVPLPQDIQNPPRHTGHGHKAHGSRHGHGHPTRGSHHGQGHHARGEAHARLSDNRSSSKHISGGRIGRTGGHHAHSDEVIVYDDSHFGSFAGRNDKNDPAFPDDEDVFAQSMEQASNNGFVPGRRRETGPSGRTSLGGNGNGTATSHNGTAWRSGRASHNPATRGETPRDTPHYTGTSHAGLSNVGTASRRGAALHGGQGTRDRMQEGKTPHGSSNARASRRGDAPTNVVSRRSVASHSDRGSLDKTTPGEGPYDTPSNPGARISSMAFADSTFRATIHTQSLRETPIGTAEGALPAKKTSLATTAAHRADEPRNNKPQGATFTNPAARPTVVAPANTTSQTAAAAHEIQQRMESMALGAATADPSPRTANTAHGVQGLPHSKAQGGLAQAYGGKATQAGPSRPQASRNGGLKSVRFQTGTPKPEAGVSDDY